MQRVYGLVGQNSKTGKWEVLQAFDADLQGKLDAYKTIVDADGKVSRKRGDKTQEVNYNDIWIADSRRPRKHRRFS